MFETYSDESFPVREERILSFWQNEEIFLKSLENRQGGAFFSFYDGPPFATGLPHYGHLLAGTIKDVVPRYKTMKGFYVPRRFGWDCHGLPVEMEIEKAKELSGAPAIEAFGIGNFNEECRSIVFRYTKEWEKTVNRMGRWVDFKENFRTMDFSFMESVWWVFSQLYGKGLVYEGFKVMPFSTKLGTPLSNFEANLNYKEVEDPSLTIAFPLRSDPGVSLLAWTTTPWTLPSNLGLGVGPEIDYVKVKEMKSGRHYILAQGRLLAYFKNPDEYTVVDTFKGKTLAGKHYEPLFPYFDTKKDPHAFKVIADDWISIEDGTGIVHLAPAFGEADFFTCQREGIALVCPVDQNGKFTHEVPDFAGLYVKDADKGIIKYLKEKRRVFHQGQIRHRYPFCWRSDTPLIYKAVRTWFIAVEKFKDQIIKSNEGIHWVPDHIKEGRFGKWLESARDWAVSRNRYWGTPIPIWRSDDGEMVVISNAQELQKRTGKKIEDLHRHFIDDLTFKEGGKTFRRIPEVFDCWFESGSMPYAQNHYPFQNVEETLETFPADFIAEGVDQTRCWFYTLTVISTALFQKPAFKNVVVNGIVLAEDGTKMSKRLKNYPEPSKVIDQYGADAIRLFFLNSPAVAAEDMKFSEAGVELVLRQVLIPFWNSYVFLSTYALIYDWDPNDSSFAPPQADIDRWILSLLQKLIEQVTKAMDSYELNSAVEPFVKFIDQLTNWYIRRCRSRFWSEEDSSDRREAFETLYTVLHTLAKVAAPFVPFLTEAIFLQLRKENDPQSVHLCDYPHYQEKKRDEKLENEMETVQTVVNAGHALRKENKLKVRQPLSKAHLITADEKKLAALKEQKQLICDELNVKEIQFSANEEDFVALSIKPNFRLLGKKVGPLMGRMQQLIAAFNQKQIGTLLSGKTLEVKVDGETVLLTPEDVAIERKVLEGLIAKESEGVTVVLDIALTEDLLLEGIAREIVNKINTMRRENGYAVSDRICVKMDTTSKIQEAFDLHKEYICHEVLALSVIFGKSEETALGTSWDINGEPATIYIESNKIIEEKL